MQNVVLVENVDTEAELDRLADHYRSAGGAGVKLLNKLGGSAESLLEQLPEPVRNGLTGATEQALWLAMHAAEGSRRAVPDQQPWVNTAVTTAMGAAGGLGGVSTALMELPATTAMLLRAIQGAAAREGFDPSAENVKFDCVRVLSAAGPLSHDDGADLGFFSVRLTLTGPAMQRLIAAVAPRFSIVLGQKLAAQSVPVLGALAGGGTNYVYTRYYQQIARVHFGLRRLAIDADIPHEDLARRLSARM
ncbi:MULTISPECIES: EcsC family protein [unclassified Ruegeria]|uniref:EcsC family protein n=1 Tax=unclassified Ruegeria TaxID=2625375 RepID=UPI0014894120|nr:MULTISPECIES: EcsC family protein [unclassified Ruegeria]NOC84343.1 EcsC family protein [Ruegeria sp. HKCCD6428]NOC93274.1 EcsC family protein [Ruegeria sp. HKCCD6604]NOE27350.1 EcsC family protein [Ruegeria sp. HKCCD6157]